MKNVVALVTGAAGCLGSATAKKLISSGCKVTLLDLPSSKGEEVARSLGESAYFYPGDVTSESDVLGALELTKNKFGSLRTVVNCAGVSRSFAIYNFNKTTACDMKFFNEVLKVNLGGTYNVIRLAVGEMAKNERDKMELRGLLINVSGFAAYDGQIGQTALAAAWGAIGSMTLPLCRELGDVGIRVMTINPGLFESRLTDFYPSKLIQALSTLTPSPKRMGFKEEFAEMVVTIMKNSFLNGEEIRINGGMRLLL